MPLREETVLENRYRIDSLLAQGGMGAIYKAFDQNLNTPVAIKENILQTPEHVAQFKQEALILARLRHVGLPRVIHHFGSAGQQYLVMDFIEGQNLWELVTERNEPLPVEQALDYMIQVCQAVSHLHKQVPPVIHRDIKPQNIKITPGGRAVLVDFGIAKALSADLHKTQAGAQRVTSGFSPPEQYTGEGTTPVSDIYALGATLYALVTAKKPPRSTNLVDGEVKLDPPNVINPRLSPQVTQAILHAMQLKPEARPESVGLWQQRLETTLAAMSTPVGVDDSTVFSKQKVPADGDDATLVGLLPGDPAVQPTRYWLVDSHGEGYPLGPEPLSVGRSVEADVVLDDQTVSREHAQLRVEADRCLVLDQNSANGTFINGDRLEDEWQPVKDNDALTFGSVRLTLTATEPDKLAETKSAAAPASSKLGSMTAAPDGPSPAETPAVASPQTGKMGRFLWPVLTLVALLLCGAVLLGGFLWTQFAPESDVSEVDRSVANQTEAGAVVEDFTPLTDQTPDGAALGSSGQPTDETTPTTEPTPEPTALTSTPAVEPTPASPGIEAREVVTRSDTISLSAATSTATTALEAPPTTEPEPAGTVEAPAFAADAENETAATDPTPIPVEAVETLDQIGVREVIDVDFNPQNYNEVYAVIKGGGIYKNVSGGAGPWSKLNIDGSGLTGLTIDPTDPTRLYAPSWNAVVKSTDGGNSWEVKANGLSTANRSINELVVHPTRPDTLFGGIGETLVVSTDGGESWGSDGYGRDLGGSQLNEIVLDPFDPETIYVAAIAGSLFKSSDGGRNFIGLPFNVGEGAYALAAHPTQPNVYLAGINAAHSAIIKSTDGFEFRSVSDGLVYGGADSPYSALAYAPSSPNIIYAGSGYERNMLAKGLFKSTDDGETWFSINSNIALNPDTGYPYYVKSIAVHPNNPDFVLIATGAGLYRSIDGGASWSLL